MTATSVAELFRPRARVTLLGGVTAAAFLACFMPAIVDMLRLRAWLNIPDAAHGILIAPVALWLAWQTGIISNARPSIWTGSAIVVNGLRIFLTVFLVFFVDPKLGEGFMHLTEGYLLVLVSLAVLAGVMWLFMWGERRFAEPSLRA